MRNVVEGDGSRRSQPILNHQFRHLSGDSQTMNLAEMLTPWARFEYGTVVRSNAMLCRSVPHNAKRDALGRHREHMQPRGWELFWQAEYRTRNTRVRCTASLHLCRVLQELPLQARSRSSLRPSRHLVNSPVRHN